MRLIILESPFAGPDHKTIRDNVIYARRCLRDCLNKDEAPLASHLLYTQAGVLNDFVPAERHRGIEAGLAWGKFAEATVVYMDRGISDGMKKGIERATAEGRPVEYRHLPNYQEVDRE